MPAALPDYLFASSSMQELQHQLPCVTSGDLNVMGQAVIEDHVEQSGSATRPVLRWAALLVLVGIVASIVLPLVLRSRHDNSAGVPVTSENVPGIKHRVAIECGLDESLFWAGDAWNGGVSWAWTDQLGGVHRAGYSFGDTGIYGPVFCGR